MYRLRKNTMFGIMFLVVCIILLLKQNKTDSKMGNYSGENFDNTQADITTHNTLEPHQKYNFDKMMKAPERKHLSPKANIAANMQNQTIRKKSQNAFIFVDREEAIFIPDDEVLRSLDLAELQELYHRYTESIQMRCRRQVHLGNELDGGYHVCEDKRVVPRKPCLVYSFGIAQDFSFDDAVSHMFGCEVHSFDFSNSMPDHQHSPNVTFHSLGIGGDNNKKKVKTLGSIRKQLGHTSIGQFPKLMRPILPDLTSITYKAEQLVSEHDKQCLPISPRVISDVPLDLLKLDVESAEWAALEEMLNDGSINDVKQLIVEFHILLIGRKIDLTDKDSYRSHLIILRRLYQAGFRIFYFRMWNHLKHLVFESPRGVPLDLLKLDVESAEWAALEEMLNDGSINDVKQLIVEFHILLIGRKIDLTDKDSYRSHLIILRRLYQAGFRIFYFRMWNHLKHLVFESPRGVSRTSCHEVHFMRVL